MELTQKLFTISDLAGLCGCSKQTIDKHINLMGLVNSFVNKNGKQVKAYELDNNQLQGLKDKVAINKGVSNVTDNSYSSINNEYINKYIEMKSLYDVAITERKLLEDRQGGLLQENRELNSRIIEQNKTIGSLEATLQAEKDTNKNTIKLYKIITISLSSALSLIIITAVCRMLFIS